MRWMMASEGDVVPPSNHLGQRADSFERPRPGEGSEFAANCRNSATDSQTAAEGSRMEAEKKNVNDYSIIT